MPKNIENGKPQLSLLPRDALEQVARAFEDGINKGYIRNDWKGVVPLSKHQDALLRHALAPNDGEIWDNDSGMLHWAKVACNALMLIHNYLNHSKLNDLSHEQPISNKNSLNNTTIS